MRVQSGENDNCKRFIQFYDHMNMNILNGFSESSMNTHTHKLQYLV